MRKVGGQPRRSREMQFILDCCSPNPPDVGATSRSDDLDWTLIEEAARQRGVTPLVARRLGAPALPATTNDARRRILNFAVANELRNQYMLARLSDLTGALGLESIGAIALKGPMLAQLAYGNIGLRVFSDLDVLVRRADVPHAAQVLSGLGFTTEAYDDAAFHANFFHTVEANFRGYDGAVNLDLHWELSPGYYPFGPRGPELWDRAIIATLGGALLATLAPEDHLLYVVAHASRHGWPTLSQICDIAYFVSQMTLDWGVIAARAARTRCERMLRIGLMLSHNLLAAEIPADILGAARADAVASSHAVRLGARLTNSGSLEDSLLRSFARSLAGIERLDDRVRYLVMHASAPTLIDWGWRPLARWQYPAYYLLRPMRIGTALIRRFWTRGRSFLRLCGDRKCA